MELSSFQLEFCDPAYQGPQVEARRTAASRVVSVAGWSPHVAAITNITPNHLDRHPSMEDYARAKEQILAHQGAADWAVLNADDPRTRALLARAAGRRLAFSLAEAVDEGAFLREETLILRLDGHEPALCRADDIPLRGRHNVANVLAAACCGLASGASVEAMRAAVLEFHGVAHRLEVVRRVGGVTYVNDSIATSPERAMAALRAFHEPLILLAGGRDKHLPWAEWADLALARAGRVVAFGEAVPIIGAALAEARARHGGRQRTGRPLTP
jgi:UDP-N-acetylmuramoylalanine--D-glutamate ligase